MDDMKYEINVRKFIVDNYTTVTQAFSKPLQKLLSNSGTNFAKK